MTPVHRCWALREIDVSPGQSPGFPRPQSGLSALPLRGNEPRTVWRKRTTSTHQEQENRVSGTMLGDCTMMTCMGRFKKKKKKLKQKSILDLEGKQNQLFIGCSWTSKYQEKSFVLQKEYVYEPPVPATGHRRRAVGTRDNKEKQAGATPTSQYGVSLQPQSAFSPPLMFSVL